MYDHRENEEVDYVEVEGVIKRHTPLAVLFDVGKVQAWIPKSLIISEEEDPDSELITLEIPEWVALKDGLI